MLLRLPHWDLEPVEIELTGDGMNWVGRIHSQGSFAGYLSYETDVMSITISRIYLEEEFRRRGFATELIESLTEWAVSQDIGEINLLADNEGSLMWHRLGFVPVESYEREDIAEKLKTALSTEDLKSLSSYWVDEGGYLSQTISWAEQNNKLEEIMPHLPWHGELSVVAKPTSKGTDT